jgi:hypothetical protein
MNEVQKVAWHIRPYQPGDESKLVVLFQRVFGLPMSEAHWRWKLRQLPTPTENVWLAADEDKVIFQYAGIPLRYRLPDGEHMAMVSVDTMASPDYRRQGFLTRVGRFTYDRWREDGIAFVIGLPNEQWGSRATALGWEVLFPLEWLVRPLRPEALLARRLKLPFLARFTLLGTLWSWFWGRQAEVDHTVQVRQVSQAGSEFDALWLALAADGLVSAVRDSAWVNWRYLTAPTYDYRVLLAERAGRPAGYVVYRLEEADGRQVGFIAELTTPVAEAAARHALINEVITRLRATGVETAVTLAVPDTWLYDTWRQAGFVPGRGAFTVQMVPLASTLPMDQLRQASKWFLTGGDFDVI